MPERGLGWILGFVLPQFGMLDQWLTLFGIEPERLKLRAPFSRQIAKPFDPNAAGQTTFHCGFDEIGREEGERDRHVDLARAACLASAKFCDGSYST